jgi:hypothetical protein
MYEHLPSKAQQAVQNISITVLVSVLATLIAIKLMTPPSLGSSLFKSIPIRGEQVIAVVSPNQPRQRVLFIGEITGGIVDAGQTREVKEPPKAFYGPIRFPGAGPDISEPKELTNSQWLILNTWRETWCKLAPPQVKEVDTEDNGFYSVAMFCSNAGRKDFFVEKQTIPREVTEILWEVTNMSGW